MSVQRAVDLPKFAALSHWVWLFAALAVCYPSTNLGATQAGRTKPAVDAKADRTMDGLAEARLIKIYGHIANANLREALRLTEKLVADYPHFQLAQLLYGDLLSTVARPITRVGDVPDPLAPAGANNLNALRAEAQLRIAAIKDRPPVNAIPSEFIALSRRNKHLIAVDTAKARLYLFENTGTGTRLLADYYISVGKAGVGKHVEGDLRTPLGVYFITSNLDPKSLPDLYGSGALPLNYPNALDLRRGKTGSGIWLHGTPSSQFTREPLATEGCVAMSNPDLDRIIRTVEIRSTPVLIGKNLKWVTASQLSDEKKVFMNTLKTWANAKKSGQTAEALRHYADDFNADGKDLRSFSQALYMELEKTGNRPVRLSDISLIRWTDEAEIMVATFGETVVGDRAGRTVRQYWQRRAKTWQIIYEGMVG